jgi:GNAT superfamily N-acetyltransferase
MRIVSSPCFSLPPGLPFIYKNKGMGKIAILKAEAHHAAQIARLLGQLGYPNRPGEVRKKISALSASEADCIWMAQFEGKPVGLLAFHLTPLLHAPGNLGRITALVVDKQFRGKGVGRRLVETAERWAWKRDCTRIELTSGEQRTQAHQFYQDLGYAVESKRFIKRKAK